MATYNTTDVNTIEHWSNAMKIDAEQLRIACDGLVNGNPFNSRHYLGGINAMIRCLEIDAKQIRQLSS